MWAVSAVVSIGVLIWDLWRSNRAMTPLMKMVWLFTVAYSNLIGLAIYFYSGRRQIRKDSLWRRSFRSVAHCYSGCGAGEITGIVLSVGLLSLGNLPTALITFTLAYVFGFALTVGPLMQEGVEFRRAVLDALWSETPSITVMEIVAIGADLWLSGDATLGEPLFWSAMIVSLTLGLFAAWPVNVWLIHAGVKEGMMNPRDMRSAQ